MPGDHVLINRDSGFELEDVIEVRARATRIEDVPGDVPCTWARRWHNVEAWKARRR